MNWIHQKHARVLAIAPSTKGFGFAVLEGRAILVDWGVKTIKRDKNRWTLEKVGKLIEQYQPEVMVLQDFSMRHSRRSPRIRALGRQLVARAASRKVAVALFTRKQVRKVFFGGEQGTKDGIAEILAKQFPEELGSRLPPRRRPWMSEDYRMGIFDAVSLALTFAYVKSITPTRPD